LQAGARRHGQARPSHDVVLWLVIDVMGGEERAMGGHPCLDEGGHARCSLGLPHRRSSDAASLRMALLFLAPTGFWAAFHYFMAAKTIVADQKRAIGYV